MNRSVLEGITVLHEEHSANDALHIILGNMIPDYNPRAVEPEVNNHNSANDYLIACGIYSMQKKAEKLLVDMFDAIIDNGEVKALQFIEDNKHWLKEA